jgi:hypothetical protein
MKLCRSSDTAFLRKGKTECGFHAVFVSLPSFVDLGTHVAGLFCEPRGRLSPVFDVAAAASAGAVSGR